MGLSCTMDILAAWTITVAEGVLVSEVGAVARDVIFLYYWRFFLFSNPNELGCCQSGLLTVIIVVAGIVNCAFG